MTKNKEEKEKEFSPPRKPYKFPWLRAFYNKIFASGISLGKYIQETGDKRGNAASYYDELEQRFSQAITQAEQRTIKEVIKLNNKLYDPIELGIRLKDKLKHDKITKQLAKRNKKTIERGEEFEDDKK